MQLSKLWSLKMLSTVSANNTLSSSGQAGAGAAGAGDAGRGEGRAEPGAERGATERGAGAGGDAGRLEPAVGEWVVLII